MSLELWRARARNDRGGLKMAGRREFIDLTTESSDVDLEASPTRVSLSPK